MATEKQIQANRLNAQKSTGPNTEQGKAVSRFNALQHGFRARAVVLPGEDPHEFAALCDAIAAQFEPEGVQEMMLAELIATAWWRMARLGIMEQGVYANERDGHFAEKPFPEFVGIVFSMRREQFKTMSDIESRLERTYYRAIRELEKLQQARRRQHDSPENPPQPQRVPDPQPAAPQSPPPPIAAQPVASGPAHPLPKHRAESPSPPPHPQPAPVCSTIKDRPPCKNFGPSGGTSLTSAPANWAAPCPCFSISS